MKIELYSGAGNTFFLIDNRINVFKQEYVQHLCNAEPVDGVILVEHSVQGGDVFMRIFNRDGSEAQMCGNGLRCLIHFLKDLGLERTMYHIDTLAGQHKGWFIEEQVCVQFPQPSHLHLNIDQNIHFLNTGVPHAIVFTPSIEDVNVELKGKSLRYSPLFAPFGTNVDFVTIQEDKTLSIRTYERGVEAETLACGTGAVAAALVANKIHQLTSPIEIHVLSGDILKIYFNSDWSEIFMRGPVKKMKSFSQSELFDVSK